MQARGFAGFEQSQLAEKAGISRSSVSRYELGVGTPRRATLIAIAFARGVDFKWLETGKTPTGGNPGGGKSTGWANRDSNPEPAD